ncbi:hypothetical protein [Kineosporia succinea]|uniref:Uncharacterized protein n=1 Tax=Kineosporia succinea TaxID=84632 RepID=A0ABT9NY11_9ACTN|nr:hypothetical protein [Kineosporia succinea]MDP9825196.1 hypothetical protein [Kineosporia succinea]
MRIKALARFLLVVAGLALVVVATFGAGGVVFFHQKWDASPTVVFMIAGLLAVLAGVIGAVPNGSIKDGSIRWPEIDLLNAVEALSDRAEKLDKRVALIATESFEQMLRVDETFLAIENDLRDLVLSLEPHPDEGLDSDEIQERDREDEEAKRDLDHEISSMAYSGEGYNDGMSIGQLRELQRAANDREKRARQVRAAHERRKAGGLVRPERETMRNDLALKDYVRRHRDAMTAMSAGMSQNPFELDEPSSANLTSPTTRE